MSLKGNEVTQQSIANELGMSQQYVSRKLKELEERNLIRRSLSKEGESIRVTENGEKLLTDCLSMMRTIVVSDHTLSIRGRVISGLGEGRIFLSLPYYVESFKKLLGFEPYPGTLNLAIYDRTSLENRLTLDISRAINIPEHKEENRVLGGVRAFPASINDVRPAAIVFPLRSVHPKSIIEVISPYHLRKELNLRDGDEVTVQAYT
nr:CTP-dependent riboflavin kinase [Metallosphaera tengchongensis]